MPARYIPRGVLQWTARFLRLFFVFTKLNQNEFRIATIAMFTSDLNAGVVPQMSPPLHDLERLRTTMVDYLIGYAASCRGLCTGRVFHPAQRSGMKYPTLPEGITIPTTTQLGRMCPVPEQVRPMGGARLPLQPYY